MTKPAPALTLRTPSPEEFHAIVQFMAVHNSLPTQHCLHGDDNIEGIKSEINQFGVSFPESFVIAVDNSSKIQGVLGWDVDTETSRAWLHGPFAVPRSFPPIAESLLSYFMSRYSSILEKVDGYYNLTAPESISLLTKAGFSETSVAHVYIAEKSSFEKASGSSNSDSFTSPPTLPAHLHAQFENLHSTLFPQTYLSAQEMLEGSEREDILFYPLIEHDQLAGYIYVSINEGENPEGYIDFLAVAEPYRGRGLAQRLLNQSLHWIFVQRNLPQAALNVNGKNTNARSLYEKVGFSLRFSGQGLRWEKTEV